MLQSRYRRIVFFFGRLLISFAFWDILLPRIGLRGWSRSTRRERLVRAAASFRRLAILMGGVMIKVGQFLSTRVDVLPPEITDELSGLQDEVPPEKFADIRLQAEADLGARLEQKFLRFEETPLAAASLGQVHRAWIRMDEVDGDEWGIEPGVVDVVVKVLRPGIGLIINTDLAALRTVGRWLARYRPIARRADVPALLDEFSRTLYQEIDYLQEGRNAEQFAANFAGDPNVRVPRVVWSLTTAHVLTLENVMAIKIFDYAAITAAGISRKEVASRLLDTYLKQIFEDGFFHADPHPGNLFVDPRPLVKAKDNQSVPAWQLTFVDFGMVGTVPDNIREGLREMLIGVGTRDPKRVIHSFEMLGVLLPGADLELIERAEERVFERYWGKSMTELTKVSPKEIHDLMVEFRELVFSLPFQVPQNMIFLARTVSILSGMCTGLDPDFNVWDHLAPYAQQLVAQEARPAAEAILNEVGDLFRSLVTIPRRLDQILTRMDRGEIAVQAPQVSRQIYQMESAIRQVAGGIIFAALLLGGIQLYLSNERPFADVLLAAAGVSLVWMLAAGRRRFG